MTDDDRELRELFARLKQDDRAHIPSFRAPAPATATRLPMLPFQLIAVAAAVVLVAIATLMRQDGDPGNRAIVPVDLRTVAWTSPTDFLLSTPGSDLIRTVPAIGAPRDWTPIGTPARAPAPESTRS